MLQKSAKLDHLELIKLHRFTLPLRPSLKVGSPSLCVSSISQIHCGKPCVSKNVLTSYFTFIFAFSNFIRSVARKVVTACETLPNID